jgi:7-cyano-7-deazaguanine synthase
MQSDSVAVFSGGLDSTTLVYDMVSRGYEPHLLSFNYGQRHKKELSYAEKTAFTLGLRHDIVDLTGITHLISNSALTSSQEYKANSGKATFAESVQPAIDVPEGHYAEDNMKLTVVPNRNMIMLSIAAGVAVNNSYKFVATGVHAGDHFVYPDCRPRFLDAANAAIVLGNAGFGAIPDNFDGDENMSPFGFLYAPFSELSKAEIAAKAFQLEVPLADTWSCYKGGETHCGRCGTCVERLEAIHEAVEIIYGGKAADLGLFDPTQYADTEFWRTAKAPTA